MAPALPVAHAMRIADEEASYFVFNTEVDDLPRGFMTNITDTPLTAPTRFVLGLLQLLPTAGILPTSALFFRKLAYLPGALPLERADDTAGDNQGFACVGGDGGKVNLSQIHTRLDSTGSLLRLGYFDAHVQFKPPVPDQGASPGVGGKINVQNERRATLAHRQDHPPLLLTDCLSGPVGGIEAFLPPGILHPHFGVYFAQFARGLDGPQKRAEDGLHRLTVQSKPPFGGQVQFVLTGPCGVGHPGLLVGLHAQVPNLCRFHLRLFETTEEGGRQVIESIDAYSLHRDLFFSPASKAVKCRVREQKRGVGNSQRHFHPVA
jgi:hypothetical protein